MDIIEADASPEKTFFLEMFIRDLTLEDCILDLIDNSIDSLIRTQGLDLGDSLLSVNSGKRTDNGSAQIRISIDADRFHLVDTCGGIPLDKAKTDVFRFGHPVKYARSGLGVYGIGLKRAMFKMGYKIVMESRTSKNGFKMDLDVPKWEKEKTWKIPLTPIDAATERNPAGTDIKISNFRDEVQTRITSATFQKDLVDMIASTYSLFLDRHVGIIVNDHDVKPKPIPFARQEGEVNIAKEKYEQDGVQVTIYAGLASRDSQGQWHQQDAGWYVACNGRLVVVADKSTLTGWGSNGGAFVPKYRGFVGLVLFHSDDLLALPWTTTKRGLNKESSVVQRARTRMMVLARPILTFLNEMYPRRLSLNASHFR